MSMQQVTKQAKNVGIECRHNSRHPSGKLSRTLVMLSLQSALEPPDAPEPAG